MLFCSVQMRIWDRKKERKKIVFSNKKSNKSLSDLTIILIVGFKKSLLDIFMEKGKLIFFLTVLCMSDMNLLKSLLIVLKLSALPVSKSSVTFFFIFLAYCQRQKFNSCLESKNVKKKKNNTLQDLHLKFNKTHESFFSCLCQSFLSYFTFPRGYFLASFIPWLYENKEYCVKSLGWARSACFENQH